MFKTGGWVLEKAVDMKSLREWLKGKKTYLTGAVAIITAISLYASGDVDLAATIQTIFGAIMGMTIRAGVQKTEDAASEE